MSLPLIATKFHVPSVRADGVTRPRLMDKLLEAADRPGTLILLSGPAGFGKTTLLSGLAAARHGDLAWDSLDEDDNDPVRFWTALISACQAVRPGTGSAASALLQSPGPLPDMAIAAMLVNDLAILKEPLFIVLDDYHVVHNTAIHAALGFLVEHLPESLRLVCSARVDPPWPLGRLPRTQPPGGDPHRGPALYIPGSGGISEQLHGFGPLGGTSDRPGGAHRRAGFQPRKSAYAGMTGFGLLLVYELHVFLRAVSPRCDIDPGHGWRAREHGLVHWIARRLGPALAGRLWLSQNETARQQQHMDRGALKCLKSF